MHFLFSSSDKRQSNSCSKQLHCKYSKKKRLTFTSVKEEGTCTCIAYTDWSCPPFPKGSSIFSSSSWWKRCCFTTFIGTVSSSSWWKRCCFTTFIGTVTYNMLMRGLWKFVVDRKMCVFCLFQTHYMYMYM